MASESLAVKLHAGLQYPAESDRTRLCLWLFVYFFAVLFAAFHYQSKLFSLFARRYPKHPRHQKFGSLTSWFRIWGCSLGFTWIHPARILTSQALITSKVPKMFLRISRKAFEPIGTCSSSVHLDSLWRNWGYLKNHLIRKVGECRVIHLSIKLISLWFSYHIASLNMICNIKICWVDSPWQSAA